MSEHTFDLLRVAQAGGDFNGTYRFDPDEHEYRRCFTRALALDWITSDDWDWCLTEDGEKALEEEFLRRRNERGEAA